MLIFIKNKYFKISVLVLGALILGLFIGKKLAQPDNENVRPENHQSGYRLISPLLECNANVYTYNSVTLKEELKEFIDHNIDQKNIKNAAIYFRDLNNGPWIGINEKEKFSMASLLKVPILITYLKIAENNPNILKEKIIINQEEENTGVSQNILPLKKVEAGHEYAIEELLEYMIKYSDNTAANALIQNCPADALDQTYSDLNLKNPLDGESENFMTVTEYSSFFRILYNASYLNREMSEKALNLLTKSDFANGLVAGLPKDILVAHKFGERVLPDSRQLHDCGIIYKNNNHYLLCVMTRGDDFNKMENIISGISSLVYKKSNNEPNN